nr:MULTISPECIES: spore germination protein [Bacillus]
MMKLDRKKKVTERDFTEILQQENPASSIEEKVSTTLKENIDLLKVLFQDCSDVVYRDIAIKQSLKGLVIYIDGMVNAKAIADNMIEHLIYKYTRVTPADDLPGTVENNVSYPSVTKTNKYQDILSSVLSGNAALFVEGHSDALLISVREGTRRGVEEPATEASIRGPREGFTENLRTNTALVRFRLKSTKLKMEAMVLGKQTQTNIVLSYIDGIIPPNVLDDVKKRLNRIEIDSILESGYIEELIEDNPYSPFPQLQYTERPDSVAGQLLEGSFAIFVDNTPFVLVGPITFWQMLHASEDYYERFYASNFIRWLRYFFLMVALFTPALYIAVITYHHDMLPTTLILSIAAAREAIPFPAVVEALIMEVAFEALREASVRLPKTIGQAVSILGALVIGQAAVEAGIVSAPMVIIVSLTGIASFTIPRFNFAIAIRLMRFPLMILAAAFGLYGIVIGSTILITHLCQLNSFGVPYFSGIAPLRKNEVKDILVRAPWWRMFSRPSTYARHNLKRMQEDNNS